MMNKRGAWKSVESMALRAASMLRPASRMTVSEWAEQNRWIAPAGAGAYEGPWRNETTPYLVEPMNELTSLDHTGVVLVSSARAGKSDISFNWIGHSVDCDPGDMRIYLQTREWALDWSQGDLERALLAKPDGTNQSVFQRHMIGGKSANSALRKRFMSGMRLSLSWPALTQLSGKTVGRVILNDYDHMDQNVGNAGPPWPMAKKRTTTFGRFGMTYAESTPLCEIVDPNWIRSTPHEAPPVSKGILTLYNMGDRRRWYWRCPDPACRESFEPEFDLLRWDETLNSIPQIAATVYMQCPCCGYAIQPHERTQLNIEGRWLKDGQFWDRHGVVTGEGEKADVASFWLKGPAAFMQSWQTMVAEHLSAMREYETTGNDGPLRTVYELSRGEPYLPPRDKLARLPESLRARSEDWGGGLDFDAKQPCVPPWVRFLVATVDVQTRSFVVQITGFGEFGEMTIIDAFKLRVSDRLDADSKNLPLAPASHFEDWKLLIPNVIEATYPLNDGSGRRMPIKMTGFDGYGEAGVTHNAYQFWRSLRNDPEGRNLHMRVHVIKGEHAVRSGNWRHRIDYPNSNQKGPMAVARGDVPVNFLNSNALKSQLDAVLQREEEGGARMRFPAWLPDFYYKQLCSEKHVPGRGWEKPSGRRNEAWDLSYYAIGLCLRLDIKLEQIDWLNPEKVPGWARPWDDNILIIRPDQKRAPLIGKAPVDAEKLRALASNFL